MTYIPSAANARLRVDLWFSTSTIRDLVSADVNGHINDRLNDVVFLRKVDRLSSICLGSAFSNLDSISSRSVRQDWMWCVCSVLSNSSPSYREATSRKLLRIPKSSVTWSKSFWPHSRPLWLPCNIYSLLQQSSRPGKPTQQCLLRAREDPLSWMEKKNIRKKVRWRRKRNRSAIVI